MENCHSCKSSALMISQPSGAPLTFISELSYVRIVAQAGRCQHNECFVDLRRVSDDNVMRYLQLFLETLGSDSHLCYCRKEHQAP